MSYGVEAFCPNKHMVKEDGKTLKAEEKADFKVIEFSKDQRKIVVSHSRIHEEKTATSRVAESVQKGVEREEGAKAVKKVKESVEKTTLGDLTALSNLKTEMEAAEKKKVDGYGEGKIVGHDAEREVVIRTRDMVQSFRAAAEPTPDELADEAGRIFEKVSEQRGMKHGE